MGFSIVSGFGITPSFLDQNSISRGHEGHESVVCPGVCTAVLLRYVDSSVSFLRLPRVCQVMIFAVYTSLLSYLLNPILHASAPSIIHEGCPTL